MRVHPSSCTRWSSVLTAAALLTAPLWSGQTLGAQHVHGQARLIVGIEGRTGQAELRATGEDVFGFEHAPRTAKERETQTVAFTKLRNDAGKLLVFEPALGCQVSARDVKFEEDKDDPHHSEVVASYQIACRVAPAGKPLRFGFSAAFPGIERVAVQLVSDTAQAGATINRDRGQVIP